MRLLLWLEPPPCAHPAPCPVREVNTTVIAQLRERAWVSLASPKGGAERPGVELDLVTLCSAPLTWNSEGNVVRR